MLVQQNRIAKSGTTLLLLAFLVLDLGYSFIQHLHIPLDGDMAAIVLPAEWYREVLDDPFGFGTLQDKKYGAPNRFFAHWPMSAYFLHIPIWLQRFQSPIDSIYLSCALAKASFQLLLVALLSAFVVARGSTNWQDRLLAATLVLPFFQTYGYNLQMGLLEQSITYSFFYSLPMAMLLCYFLPFYNGRHKNWHFGFAQHLLLVGLALALPFSGPLVAAIVLLICPAALVKNWWEYFIRSPQKPLPQKAWTTFSEIPSSLRFHFLLIILSSLWSLYVGSFNVENPTQSVPIFDRYVSLLVGLGSIGTIKLGLPLIILGIAANVFLLTKKADPDDRQRLFSLGKWLAAFAIAYLLLLPLGGYRSYRPLIVRHDTLLPVTVCLIFYYCLTTFHLLRKTAWPQRRWYALGAVAMALAFTAADQPRFGHNACEKAALKAISNATETMVEVSGDCTVMSWSKPIDPSNSELNMRLLKHWQIAGAAQRYFSK